MIPKQPDYLMDVGRSLRLVSAVLLGLFAVICGLIGAGGAIACVVLAGEGKPGIFPFLLYLAAGMAAFGLFIAWLALRLARGDRSANQVTVLPAWVIQVFGVLLAPGMLAGANEGIQRRQWNVTVMCVGIVVAMIGVPWLIRHRRATAKDT